MQVIPSERLAGLDALQRGSGFNEELTDPLELAFNYDIFRHESTNPFLAQKVIAYHNSGIVKCFNFVMNYVFFLNFEGECLFKIRK